MFWSQKRPNASQVVLRTFQVQLPADAAAGEELLVAAPDGRQMKITVPRGVVAGGDNRIAVPWFEHAAADGDAAAFGGTLRDTSDCHFKKNSA